MERALILTAYCEDFMNISQELMFVTCGRLPCCIEWLKCWLLSCCMTSIDLYWFQEDRVVLSATASQLTIYGPQSMPMPWVGYKTPTGPRPGLVIKCGLKDCMYAMLIRLLSLMRFWCFFLSPKRRQTISTTHLCGITALFGVFLETKTHQNLMRLSSPIIIAYMQSMSPCFITSPGPGRVRVL